MELTINSIMQRNLNNNVCNHLKASLELDTFSTYTISNQTVVE